MKTIVLGSAGQLGRELTVMIPGPVVALTRADADLTDAAALRACLELHRPNRVINCAAYNLVDRAETEPEVAFAVNSGAVRTLALICRDLDAMLVHFSTDYVFGLDSERRRPWTVDDATGPVSAYALSKLAGEYWVRMYCQKHLVVRTCGLYGLSGQGGKGGNFVETMLRLAAQEKPLRVVNDQRCCPSFAHDVAKATVELMEKEANGLFHLTNAGDCSWFEFAGEIFRQANVKVNLMPITSAEFGAAARRPAYSVLDNGAAIKKGVSPLRSWQSALADYLSERSR